MNGKNSLVETKNNLFKFEIFTNKKSSNRPDTPHIDFLSLNEENNPDSLDISRHFSLFMKQIIDMKNNDFINGNIDVIEYILSKFANLEIKNLKHLEKISLRLSHEFELLNQFGQRLPKLLDLRLNGSNIISVSNIGTTFENLIVLQINNCNIKDLSGIICFKNLEILEAADNKIFDLIELEMCSKLKKLNLRNNLIKDEDNIFFLTGLTDLKYLNLNQNPIQLSKNYKNLLEENLSFIDKIDKDEAPSLNLPKNNGNLDLEKIFDLTKKDLPNEKKMSDSKSKASSTLVKNNINTSQKNVEAKETKNNFFSVSKSKLAKFGDLKSISTDKKPIDKADLTNKKENDFMIKTSTNFNLDSIKKNKIVIDASGKELETSKKTLNLPDLRDKKTDMFRESKNNFAKIDEHNHVDFMEKHKAPTKEDLIQKMEKMNKELSQKSQDVTKRLYPVRNFEDFEKTAQKTLGKFKILSNSQNPNLNGNNNNNHLPGLLKKTRDSKNVMLPKINEMKQGSDDKNETKTILYKKEIIN